MDNHLVISKLLAASVFCVLSIVVGSLPLFIARRLKTVHFATENGGGKLAMSLMLCFSGGVLFFTAFLHVQPEVRHTFKQLAAINCIAALQRSSGLELSEIVICCGFFLVYLMEEIAHSIMDSEWGKRHQNSCVTHPLNEGKPSSGLAPLQHEISVCPSNECHELTHSGVVYPVERIDKCVTCHLEPASTKRSTTSLLGGVDGDYKPCTNKSNVSGKIRGAMAILSLSIHSLFEGIAVGCEENVSNVWYLLTAVATHKFAIVFCLSVELIMTKSRPLSTFVNVSIFSAVTPVGIVIGAVLTASTDDSVVDVTDNVTLFIVDAVLQGMAAGTLLYVIFFEILARERDINHNGLAQLLATMFGFIFMGLVQTLGKCEFNMNF